MAYREKENEKVHLGFEATIIPHSEDGKHSAEIVLTDSRWPTEHPIPRPSVTVGLEKPFDPEQLIPKLKVAFEKSVLDFVCLGVVSTIAHCSRREKAAQTAEELESGPRAPVDIEAVLEAARKVGIELPNLVPLKRR